MTRYKKYQGKRGKLTNGEQTMDVTLRFVSPYDEEADITLHATEDYPIGGFDLTSWKFTPNPEPLPDGYYYAASYAGGDALPFQLGGRLYKLDEGVWYEISSSQSEVRYIRTNPPIHDVKRLGPVTDAIRVPRCTKENNTHEGHPHQGVRFGRRAHRSCL